MAKSFNLTAQINLQGPTNIKPVVAQIKRELGAINTDLSIKFDPKAAKGIDVLTQKMQVLNKALIYTNKNAQTLGSTLNSLGSSIKGLGAINKVAASVNNANKSINNTAKVTKAATSQMQDFGKQSALAIRRFAAFSVVTSGVLSLANAIRVGTKSFIDFDKQLIRLQQVTGAGAVGIKALQDEITSLAINLGVSSESLTEVAVTLAQAGFSARETQQALAALAKTELAPSFDNLTDTTEGAIAAIRQFGIETKDLEKVLGSINAVAAAFAVESSDIITAIQRAGGAFAASSKGVSEGADALNEFIAVFTSVRATTRESAETIATGLRTIFTRIQRGSTIKFLEEFGIQLTDIEGKFVGPFEAVKRLSVVLRTLDPRDLRFSQIVEELGGFRQISKVIPLIQQFAESEKALAVAQKGQSSLSEAQVKAQQSLANQLARVREEFLALIRAVGQSQTFQALFKIVLGLTSGLIKLVSVFKPILPLFAVLGAFKGASALTKFAGGFIKNIGGGGGGTGGTSTGGPIPPQGGPTGGSSSAAATTSSTKLADELISNTKSVNQNTTSLDNLTAAINNLKTSGGSVSGFAKGGFVPGSGNRDTVPAMLTPGEFVIRKKAVETIGADKLHKMNKYAGGGKIQLPSGGPTEFTHLDARVEPKNFSKKLKKYLESQQMEVSGIYSNMGLDLPKTWNRDWAQARDEEGAFSDNLASYIRSKDVFKTLKSGSKKYRFTGRGDSIAQQLLIDNANDIKQQLADNVKGVSAFYDVDPDVSRILPGLLTDSIRSILSKDDSTNLIKGFKEKSVYKEGTQRKKINEAFRQNLMFGGFVQKFLRGGTVEETSRLENISLQDSILSWLKELGGIQGVKQASGIGGNDRTLDSILRANSIKSGNAEKLKSAANAINKALSNKVNKQVREAESINKNLKLAIVGLEPLGFSDDRVFDTGFGKAALLLRGLPNDPMYASLIEQTRQGVGQLSTNLAKGLQSVGAFGGQKPIALDFDETLVSGADIFDDLGNIDIAAYGDLDRVKKALKNGKLTSLAEKLKSILEFDPSFIDNIRVLTARNQSNAPLLAQRLNELGLPIPASKITGTSGGGATKATALGVSEKLIDDNYENILAAIRQGKTAKQYAELRDISEAESRASGIANAEGAILQIALAKLGAQGGTIKEAALDFENGLGLQASQVFGLPPDIPTEVKRTLSSAAIGRAEDEFRRYFSETYGPFAKGSDVYSISKTTGLPVSRFADGGEVISRGNVKYLKSDIEKAMQSMGLSYDDFFKKISAPNSSFDQFMVGGFGPEAIEFPKNLRPYTPKSFVQEEMEKASAAKNARIQAALEKRGQRMREYEPRARFAFGGLATSNDSGFEKIRKKIIDEYPDINFRISKRKGGFGYNILGGLKQEGSNIGNYAEFKQASNLSKLQEVADKMASSLLYEYGPNIDPSLLKKKRKFAKGGSAEDTVPALLTPGEFVINKKAAQKIGYGKLNKLNKADKLQGYNKGGPVGFVQKFAAGGDVEELFTILAEQAGKTLKEFEQNIKNQILERSLSGEAGRKSSRLDLRKEFVKTKLKFSPDDLRNQDNQQQVRESLQSSLEGLLDPSELNDAIDEIIYGLGTGATSLEEIAKISPEVAKALDSARDQSLSLADAHKQLEDEMGALTDSVKVTAEEMQAFEYKKSGKAQQEFGMLGNFNPAGALAFKQSRAGGRLLGAAQNFMQTGGLGGLPVIGKGIGSLSKALENLPGPIGNAIKAVGGLPGAFAAVTSIIGSEVIPQLLKAANMGTSEIGAGIGGALAEGGSRAASMGALGAQIAGPIGAAVGVITGALSGAIQGFTNAFRTKKLENSLAKLNSSIENVDKAFANLAEKDNIQNVVAAQKSLGGLTTSFKDLQVQAEVSLGERAANVVSYGAQGTGYGALGALALLTGGGLLAATGVGIPAGATAMAAGGTLLAGGAIGLGYGAIKGPDELDDEALQASLKAAEKYIEGLNQLAERDIKLQSLTNLEKTTKVIDQINKDLLDNKITSNEAEALKKAEFIRLGTQGAAVENAQRSALINAGINIRPDQPLAQQIQGNEDATIIAAAAAENAAYMAGMEKLKRLYGENSDMVRKEGKDRDKVIQMGREELGMREYQMASVEKLTRLTKDMAKQTEELAAAYTRALAQIGRFKDELENFVLQTGQSAALLTGEGGMGQVNRGQEQMLRNMTAYTAEELKPVLENVAKLAGGGEQAQKLTQSIQASKIMQQILPDLLRNTPGRDVGSVLKQLDESLGAVGIGESVRDTLVEEVRTYLERETGGRDTGSFQEVLDNFPALADAIDSTKKAQEVGVAILEAQNDALQAVNEQLDQYNKYLRQALQWSIRADTIRLEGAIALDRALGRDISLERLSAPFTNEIKRLTEGLGLPGGATTDPVAIAEGIRNNEARIREIVGDPTVQGDRGLLGQAMNQEEKKATEETRKLTQEQADLTRASADAYDALERLATNGDIAANILGKIEEERQQGKNVIDFVRRVSTQSSEDGIRMIRSFKAFDAAVKGNLNFRNRENRQLAYEGMDTLLPLLKGSETGNRILQRMTENMLIGQGMDIDEENYAGSGKTLRELIAAGTTGMDPGTQKLVALYQQAIGIQAEAAAQLSNLNGAAARKHLAGTERILTQLYQNLPIIIATALTKPDEVLAGQAQAPPLQLSQEPENKPVTRQEIIDQNQPVPVVIANQQNNAGAGAGAPINGQNIGGPVNNQIFNALSTSIPVLNTTILNNINSINILHNGVISLKTSVDNLIQKLADNSTNVQPIENFGQNIELFGSKVNTFNEATISFGSYVDKLSGVAGQLSNAKITMGGNYTVDVRVSGAAAFQAIEEKTQQLIDKEIGLAMDDMINKIKKATGMNLDLNRRQP